MSHAYIIWGSTDRGGPFSSDHGKVFGVALTRKLARAILNDLQDDLTNAGVCPDSGRPWRDFWIEKTELFE